MSSLNESVMTLLSMTDNQFITLSNNEITNLEHKLAGLQRELSDSKNKETPPPTGLWMAAPKNMTLDAINSFVLMSFIYNGQRSWEVFPKNNMLLALRYKASGQLWIEMPFIKPKRGRTHRSGLGSGPNPEEAASRYTGVKRIDLFDKISTSLPPGSYTATALYFDMVSNSVQFSMNSKDGELPKSETQAMPIITDVVIDTPKEVALDAAKPLEVKARLSASSTEPWHGNVIALLVDEAPIIIPFSAEADTTNLTITIDLQEKSKEWQAGLYQIYVDVGDHIVGPVSMTVTK